MSRMRGEEEGKKKDLQTTHEIEREKTTTCLPSPKGQMCFLERRAGRARVSLFARKLNRTTSAAVAVNGSRAQNCINDNK